MVFHERRWNDRGDHVFVNMAWPWVTVGAHGIPMCEYGRPWYGGR